MTDTIDRSDSQGAEVLDRLVVRFAGDSRRPAIHQTDFVLVQLFQQYVVYVGHAVFIR